METLSKYFIGDKWIWRAVFVLMIASVWFGLSSSSAFAYQKFGSSTAMIVKHAGMLIATLFVTCLVARFPPKYFAGLAPLAVAFSFVLLILVLVIGSRINGSARWLSIGGLTFQPSEIAKISMVLFVSRVLARDVENPSNQFFLILMVSGAILLPIMLENLSTAVLLGATIFYMLIIGRVRVKYWGTLLLLVVVAMVTMIGFHEKVARYIPRVETWHNRIARRAGGNSVDRTGGDYQASMAELGIASATLTGKGPGKSYIKNFLPMSYSDFIFVIIVEETGVLGMLVIILCYVLIMWRATRIGRKCATPFQLYTILGLSYMMCLQAIINMLVGSGVVPVTGQTLPFVSMGGSSNIFTGVAVGIMLSISCATEPVVKIESPVGI